MMTSERSKMAAQIGAVVTPEWAEQHNAPGCRGAGGGLCAVVLGGGVAGGESATGFELPEVFVGLT